ncbi:MAG: MaoC/PaaZ C-terminal domain-containing protein [Microbacteriaceae bacterium]
MSAQNFDQLEVGGIVAEAELLFDRAALVRYAGASGDFNPIHFSDEIARSVGLEGVLAHGMLTMGAALQPLVNWLGDVTRVVDYQVRFTRPVWVEPGAGSTVSVQVKFSGLDVDSDLAKFELSALFAEKAVLGKAIALVRPVADTVSAASGR